MMKMNEFGVYKRIYLSGLILTVVWISCTGSWLSMIISSQLLQVDVDFLPTFCYVSKKLRCLTGCINLNDGLR